MSKFFQRRRVYRWLREIIVLLLLAAVLGFGAWQWQQSPTGLWPKAAAAAPVSKHAHHDRD